MNRKLLLPLLLASNAFGCIVLDPGDDIGDPTPADADASTGDAPSPADSEDGSSESGGETGDDTMDDPSIPDDHVPRIVVPGLDEVRDDVLPLFVLGDVNEDGIVDDTDVELLGLALDGLAPESVTCLAAGDISRDGELDEADFDRLVDMVADGPPLAPALFAAPYLPCSYSGLHLAASLEIEPDAPVRLRIFGDGDETLEVVPEGPVEVAPAEDGRGVDVWSYGELEALTLDVFFGGGAYVLTLAAGSNSTATPSVPFIDAGDDPRDTPPPVIYGEEIDDLAVCPQKDDGCEALVVDFLKYNDLIAADADQTRNAIIQTGCHVTYAAPRFRGVPKPLYFVDAKGQRVESPVSIDERNSVIAANAAAWTLLRQTIADHRTLVAEGRSLVYELVTGHGSKVGCGSWGPGFSTNGMLGRTSFHRDNYRFGMGKVCHWVSEDRSCYAGRTAMAVESANNTGTVQCTTAPSIDHAWHGAFFGDMAIGSSSANEVTYNGEVLVRDIGMAGMIQQRGKHGDWGELAQGFREEAVNEESPSSWFDTEGRYSDRGYNHNPGTFCETASHVSAH
jgi:hypothetical protein